MKKVLALLLIALVAAPFTASAAKLKVGDPMVPFVLPTADGKTVDSTTLVGKGPIVLNFMNTVCATCVAELNDMKKLLAENPKVQFFAVAVDMRGAEAVAQFQKEMGFQYTFLLDPKFEVARKYWVSSTPNTVVIDKAGNVAAMITGYNEEDKKPIEEAIKK